MPCYLTKFLRTILFYCASFSFPWLLTYILFKFSSYYKKCYAKLVIPIGIPTREAKAEIETSPITVEIKISKRPI